MSNIDLSIRCKEEHSFSDEPIESCWYQCVLVAGHSGRHENVAGKWWNAHRQHIPLTEEPIASLIKACLETKINYVESQLQDHAYRGLLWRCIESVRAPKPDVVNHPPHYKGLAGIEVIDVLEAFGLNFRLANCVKYILRHANKGHPLEDLKKAQWYLNREISKMEQK